MRVNESGCSPGGPQHLLQRTRRGAAQCLIGLVSAMFAFLGAGAQAATSANSQSPLGINLNGVNYWTGEQPFINLLKTTSISGPNIQGGWYTSGQANETNEEAYLQVDSNGYPTTLVASSADPNKPQKFTYVQTGVLTGLTNSNAGTGLPYRAGQYVVLYDGAGSLRYAGDAHLVSSAPGRDVVNVDNPTGSGINLQITATTPGNYIHNIRVVYAPEEALLAAGQIFEPAFLAKLQNFRAARFMDWRATNNSPDSSWAARSQASYAGWGGPQGVPWEVIVSLANQAGVDAWVNVPHKADDDYIRQMATLFHNTMSSSLHVYVEYSNEAWNTGFTQTAYVTAMGKATWPNAPANSDFNRNYFGMRTAQIADIWKSVWGGDFSRVTIVLGGQAANTYVETAALATPLWTGAGNGPASAHPISAVAIAPYFGENNVPLSWLSLPQATALNQLFAQINTGGVIPGAHAGGYLKQVSEWTANTVTAMRPYNLPVLAYEGGQTFNSFGNWQTDGTNNGSSKEFIAFYTAAQRDPRMGQAYTAYFNQWKANGGQLFMHFVDVTAAGTESGDWGALESFLDTTTPLSASPPKWQALQNFISNNPCWWSGCTGAVGSTAPVAVPMAPSNLHVIK